jgi:hypothetical protein
MIHFIMIHFNIFIISIKESKLKLKFYKMSEENRFTMADQVARVLIFEYHNKDYIFFIIIMLLT